MSDKAQNPKQNDSMVAGEAYRVLARKYRPASFADLIGQQPMVQTLSNAFEDGRIAQAYMLTGVRGVGKTTTARILARALNYKTENKDAPDLGLAEMGEHCADIMAGHHVDVMEMDAASHTGIEDIREIIASTQYRPTTARYKVYIIDEVHMLSKNAFNGLLKTLEEPPEHVKFIFATTEIRKVPITVLSRCQRFDLRRIDAGEMISHLEKVAGFEDVEVDEDALAMIARASEGSVRDALSLFDQAIAHADGKVVGESVREMLGLADRTRVIDLFEFVMKGDTTAALEELKSQYDVGADPSTVLNDLAGFVHFVTRVRFVPLAVEDRSFSEQERKRGREFAKNLTPRVLGRAWQILLKGIGEVQTSERPLAAADMVLVRLTHAADLPTPDEALRQLASHSKHSDIAGTNKTGDGNSDAENGIPAAHHPTQFLPSVRNQAVASPERRFNDPVLSADSQATIDPVQYEQINSFDELLAVAERKRDIAFKLALRNHVRLVSFSRSRMEINITGNPPASFVNDISGKLQAWTGERWMIVAGQRKGEATLKEQEDADREKIIKDATSTPTVAAILAKFPGSTIVDIRVQAIEQLLDDPALEESGDEDLKDFYGDN